MLYLKAKDPFSIMLVTLLSIFILATAGLGTGVAFLGAQLLLYSPPLDALEARVNKTNFRNKVTDSKNLSNTLGIKL